MWTLKPGSRAVGPALRSEVRAAEKKAPIRPGRRQTMRSRTPRHTREETGDGRAELDGAGVLGLDGLRVADGGGRPRVAADRPVRRGALSDQSTVYTDYQGIGSVIAAQLALEDWAARSSVRVEMIPADRQNLTDVGIRSRVSGSIGRTST